MELVFIGELARAEKSALAFFLAFFLNANDSHSHLPPNENDSHSHLDFFFGCAEGAE